MLKNIIILNVPSTYIHTFLRDNYLSNQIWTVILYAGYGNEFESRCIDQKRRKLMFSLKKSIDCCVHTHQTSAHIHPYIFSRIHIFYTLLWRTNRKLIYKFLIFLILMSKSTSYNSIKFNILICFFLHPTYATNVDARSNFLFTRIQNVWETTVKRAHMWFEHRWKRGVRQIDIWMDGEMKRRRDRWMDSWMERWADGWMQWWIDGSINGLMDWWMGGEMDGWTHDTMGRWLDGGWTKRWVDKWTNGR